MDDSSHSFSFPRHAPPPRVAIVALLVLQTAALWVFASRSYYFVDDFIYFVSAGERTTPELSYLVEPAFQHFIPGHRLIFWCLHHAWPLRFEAALAFMLLAHALSSLVLLRLLGRLCGPWAALALTLIWALAPAHVRNGTWAAAGVEYFPCNLFTLLALERVLAYWRDGRARQLAVGGLCMALGLLFFMKALLVLGYLGLLWLLFSGLRPAQQRARRTGLSLAVLGGVAAAYLYVFLEYYYFRYGMGGGPKPSLLEVLSYTRGALVDVALPSFLSLLPEVTPHYAWVGAALWAAWLALAVRHPDVRRWILFFVGAALPNVLLIAVTRIKVFDPMLIMLDQRYYAEVGYLLALALGGTLGALGVRLAPGRPRRWVGAVLAAAALLWAGAFVRAADHQTRSGLGQLARPYVVNLQRGLGQLRARHGGDYSRYAFFSGSVPDHVMPGWLGAGFGRYDWFFRVVDPRVQTEHHAPAMYTVDARGNVRTARFVPVGEAIAPGAGACLEPGGEVTLTLPSRVELSSGVVELELDRDGPFSGEVGSAEALDSPQPPPLHWARYPGEPSSYSTFTTPRSFTRVRVRLDSIRERVCVRAVRVGTIEASSSLADSTDEGT